jgi:actin-related protein
MIASNPICDAWHGGADLIASDQLITQFVNKSEYDEKGQSRICNQRFDQ